MWHNSLYSATIKLISDTPISFSAKIQPKTTDPILVSLKEIELGRTSLKVNIKPNLIVSLENFLIEPKKGYKQIVGA